MAYKPSLRRSAPPTDVEINILPVMNLMACLIPILLSAAEFVKVAILPLNLPPASAGGGGGKSSGENKPKEAQKKLGLTVALKEDGIYIASPGAVLGSSDGGPTVPKSASGDYNFKELNKKLREIKQKIKGQNFIDEDQATITATQTMEYKHIIHAMDAMRIFVKPDFNEEILFPNVSVGVAL